MKRLYFLHIPKTAGQSVHAYLVEAFGQPAISPARVMNQLKRLSLEERRRHQVFSGHFDWTALREIDPEGVTLTVLRDPVDRILSFYYFLRREAEDLTEEQLHSGKHEGMRAAHTLTADEFFRGGRGELRAFLDDHFDNFYAYYFATGRYNGRRVWKRRSKGAPIDESALLAEARAGLARVDVTLLADDWQANITESLRAHFPDIEPSKKEYFVNRGDGMDRATRRAHLLELGGTQNTLDRIEEMVTLDRVLFDGVVRRALRAEVE